MRHRCRHHSAPVPTPQTRPPHMLSGQVSVVPRAPVAPGTQLPPALKTERFGPRCHGGENGDHLRTRPHKRKGGKVGRTGGAHSTSPRLPYIAASRHGRPASCRRLSQAAPMLSCCDDAPPTAPPVPPIITGCCPRALAAGWAWRCTQRQDCRGRAVQRCRGVGRCVGGRTPSSHSQLRPPRGCGGVLRG